MMKIYAWVGLFCIAFFPAARTFAVELTGNLGVPSANQSPNQLVRMPNVGSLAGGFSVYTGISGGSTSQAIVIQASNPSDFTININAGATLAGNSNAMAAFQRAAQQWVNVFSNPITVTIDADLAPMGSTTIIGQSNAVALQGSYTEIRDQMVASAIAEGSHDALAAALPALSQFQVAVPVGYTLSGNIYGTKANLKAMGFEELDEPFGVSDGSITFNSEFPFTYNNASGVAAGTIDFESVAAHELGHALGFITSVDDIDYAKSIGMTGAFSPAILDMFRFASSGANHPTTVDEFTTFPREFSPIIPRAPSPR